VTVPSPGDGPLAWNVAGLLADEPGADRTYEVAGVTIDLDDLTLAEPIAGRVRLLRTNRGILATADLRGMAPLLRPHRPDHIPTVGTCRKRRRKTLRVVRSRRIQVAHHTCRSAPHTCRLGQALRA
jgi:hypothetical protein